MMYLLSSYVLYQTEYQNDVDVIYIYLSHIFVRYFFIEVLVDVTLRDTFSFTFICRIKLVKFER